MSAFADHALTSDNRELRRALYRGDRFKLPATDASRLLAADVLELLQSELGAASHEVRSIPTTLDGEDFFYRIGRVRKQLFLDPHYEARVRAVLAASGFDPGRIAFDPLRLRVVAHLAHQNPRAAPVYYPHRDTWYGHPQSIVTWWIPLHDLSEDETFVFYPERFAHPVPNDSEIFDYDAWVRKGWSLKIGWQDIEAGRTARYPQVTSEVEPGPALSFACVAGENVLFSGAQFHRTLPQSKGICRFSLDFRIVHLGDHDEGIGAPNVDNRSRGSALVDYSMPEARGAGG